MKKLVISRKDNLKGEDGYKTFSIRVRERTVSTLDELAINTGRSRNELINTLLEFGIENVEISDSL